MVPATPAPGTPTLHRLSNGRYRVDISEHGTGYSSLGELRLIGGSSDAEAHHKGLFLYLRDLEQDRIWSAGLEPMPGCPSRYEIERNQEHFAISRVDDGVQLRVDTCVVPDHHAELRAIRITNGSARNRSLELTSYAEVVLHDSAAHQSHPTFSKLFLQTEFVPDSAALLVRRRPRSPHESYPYVVHALIDAEVHDYETDRARFLGRRRSPDRARALSDSDALSKTTGDVLDPILSLRTRIQLAAGESVHMYLLVGAAQGREDALAIVDTYASPELCDTVFENARRQPVVKQTLIEASSSSGDDGGPEPQSRDAKVAPQAASRGPGDEEQLLFFNGYGGFSEDGKEYVIRLPWREGEGLLHPPQPWINVLANENFGSLLSESGAGYTWHGNSRLRRLTPWQNDPVVDPHSEAFYIRDEDDGSYGSPLPGPTPFAAPYEVRHGFGVTRFRVRSNGISYESSVFVARKDPVRFACIRLSNESGRRRRLSLYAYSWLTLSDSFDGKGNHASIASGTRPGRLLAQSAHEDGEIPLHALADLIVDAPGEEIHVSANRTAFLGEGATLSRPSALEHASTLGYEEGHDDQACFAQQVMIEVPEGATATVVFLLGGGESSETLESLGDHYSTLETVTAAEEEVLGFWEQQLSTVRITTPSRALDIMVNGWLPYQTLSCRIWARSALYQSGGAFGFRDQLQDASSLTHVAPKISRQQILLHAAHQFVEGDVLHWWHPPHDQGIRTRFVDDLVWLPHLTAHYIQTTGDVEILEESIPFLRGPALEEGQDEVYMAPKPAGITASLYQHCCRALDRSLTAGQHGLPLFGTGDWNDGMNRVGRLGRGESTWMGLFLYMTLGEFLGFCDQRGDTSRAEEYRRYRGRLKLALNDAGWDGGWYLRGYYDDDAPLGSSRSDECRIDGLVQAWSILADVAPPERAEMAIEAADRLLVSEEDGLIRLLTPPFAETSHDPGYIKGYVRGVRENGGQYTHAALWLVRAMAQLKKRDRVARLLELLNPINHALTPEQVETYRVEPYVVAADVYGAEPHVGRGGWTWYTGSSGWMSRVVLESLLGLRVVEGRAIQVDPCIPDDWPGFSVEYRPLDGGSSYSIEVRSPAGAAEIIHELRMDGELLPHAAEAGQIPLMRDDQNHSVRIEMRPANPRSSSAELGRSK